MHLAPEQIHSGRREHGRPVAILRIVEERRQQGIQKVLKNQQKVKK